MYAHHTLEALTAHGSCMQARKRVTLVHACIHVATGTPCVFYDHLYTEENGLRKAILELMDLRKKKGLHCRWAWWQSSGGL